MPLNISGSIVTPEVVREYEYNSIIQDGLVLHLDARIFNTVSGTTWYDFSGNGNNGTLTNGPTFNSSNQGSISFDGSNDYILLPSNFFSFPSTTTFTISLWFKCSLSDGRPLFSQQNTSNPNSATGWVPVIYLQPNGYVRVEPFWTGAITNKILSTNTLNDNTWHNVVTTFNNGTNQLYVDGSYNSQQTGLTLTNYTSTYYYFIGAAYITNDGRLDGTNSLGNTYYNGLISHFCFYDKALSSTEIQHNYNLTKYRYGL